MKSSSNLQIGNWIFDPELHQEFQVESISPLSKNSNNKNLGITYRSGSSWSDIEDGGFNRIPLTIDWIERFGFIRQGNRKMWVKEGICVILAAYPNLKGEIEGEKFFIGFKDMGGVIYHTQFEIPYVNDLQNGYAISGKQLEEKDE